VEESIVSERLAGAVDLRRTFLGLDATTDAYRVVHSEGDGLPGLIVDRYCEYAVVELFSFPMYRRVANIQAELKRLLGVEEVLVRADQRVQAAEGFVLPEDAPTGAHVKRSADRKSTVIAENGVRFQIDLTHGHKTGFFCDQRENRLALTRHAKGANILDLCCYSGGFGVYAAARGKAAHVTCVDLDDDAIALAQRNANLNKVPRNVFETVHADSFPYLRRHASSREGFY
jgi:23S rRNA (cytosine1962-C5)-methyltransferase